MALHPILFIEHNYDRLIKPSFSRCASIMCRKHIQVRKHDILHVYGKEKSGICHMLNFIITEAYIKNYLYQSLIKVVSI